MVGPAGMRIKLHFIPPYCPHLDPIDQLCGLTHRYLTFSKCPAKYGQFAYGTLIFLCEKAHLNWADLHNSVTDVFHAINSRDFRVAA